MKVPALIIRELWHRRANAASGVVAVVVAVALPLAAHMTTRASSKETTRLMRDLGYNVRIIPATTDMNHFWLEGFSDQTMDQSALDRFVTQDNVAYNHLIAQLHGKTQVEGKEVLLTGLSPEVAPPGKKKSPMIFEVQPGTVYLGSEVAASMQLKQDDTLDLFGRPFRVEQCLSETGSEDDIRIYFALADLQQSLQLPGRINEIKALNCLCLDETKDSITILREALEELLPEGRVVQLKALADAREKQRVMVDRMAAFLVPVAVLMCAIWLGVAAYQNVRQRRAEIGVYRALGYASSKIAALFLGRALVLGLAGALIGIVIGMVLALRAVPQLFPTTASKVTPDYSAALWLLVTAPLLAAVCTFIPAMLAVRLDPARTLNAE